MEARTPLGYRDPAGPARAPGTPTESPRAAPSLRVRSPLFELGHRRPGALRWSRVLVFLLALIAGMSLRFARHERAPHLDSDRCLELGS